MSRACSSGKLGLDGHDVGRQGRVPCADGAGFRGDLHRACGKFARRGSRPPLVQEDVDAIGVSILSGAHLPLLEQLAAVLRTRGSSRRQAVVRAGGVIPQAGPRGGARARLCRHLPHRARRSMTSPSSFVEKAPS